MRWLACWCLYIDSAALDLTQLPTPVFTDMHTVCVVLLIYFVGSSLTALMLISGVYQVSLWQPLYVYVLHEANRL